jgi:hypothetical protein
MKIHPYISHFVLVDGHVMGYNERELMGKTRKIP